MPGRRKTKQKRTKRTRTKRKGFASEPSFNLAPRSQMNTIPGDFQGDATRVKLRFVDHVAVVPNVSGQYVSQLYGINTPRVPEQSGATGVSQGWGIWSGQYARYLPLGAKIRWQILSNPQAIAGVTLLDEVTPKICMYPASADMVALTGIDDACVQKYAKWYVFPDAGGSTNVATTQSTDPRNTWKGKAAYQVDKLSGLATLQNATFAAVVASDPSLKWYFYFAWQDTSANAHYHATMNFSVEIEYDVLFYSRASKANALLERPGTKRVVHVPKESAVETKLPDVDAFEYIRMPKKTQSLKA